MFDINTDNFLLITCLKISRIRSIIYYLINKYISWIINLKLNNVSKNKIIFFIVRTQFFCFMNSIGLDK